MMLYLKHWEEEILRCVVITHCRCERVRPHLPAYALPNRFPPCYMIEISLNDPEKIACVYAVFEHSPIYAVKTFWRHLSTNDVPSPNRTVLSQKLIVLALCGLTIFPQYMQIFYSSRRRCDMWTKPMGRHFSSAIKGRYG